MRAACAFLLGFATGLVAAVGWLEQQVRSGPDEEGATPTDAQVAASIRAEWRRLGLLADQVDVSVSEGVTHVRGQADRVTADTLIATARRLPGVADIRDEVTRAA